MGNVLSSPKKLKPGMKVLVCWHRDWIPFTYYQTTKGYKHGKWFKGELLSIGKGEWTRRESFVVRINCDDHCLYTGDVIIIRSTSREDNLTPSELRTNERQRKAYRAKKLAATENKMLYGR